MLIRFDATKNRATLAQAIAAVSTAKQFQGLNPSAIECANQASLLLGTRGPAYAHEWARESLAHSVGVFSPVYQRIARESR